jgi:hypothetical protein
MKKCIFSFKRKSPINKAKQSMKYIVQALAIFIFGSMQSLATTTEQTTEHKNTYSNNQPIIDGSSPNDIKNHMVYKLIPVMGEATFAPNLVSLDPSLSENFSEIYLVRTENFDEGEIFTLFVTALYTDTGWRNYTDVTSPRANDLSLATITKKSHGCDHKNFCQYEERISIEIGFVEIIDSLTTNLELNIIGKKTQKITIPGNYLLAMMRTIKSE